ncbi:MAG TPA: class I SAM-dependent methyltransferase [Cyclobacteriaceae bacterium]|nr:class I SAM-dependent methyltransferase [Cyclobacteriaceae bacterium]
MNKIFCAADIKEANGPFSLVAPDHIADLLNMAAATPAGAFVEIGVYRGGTAFHLDRLAKEQGRFCYLYDTFEGIPYTSPVDHHQVGDFADASFEDIVKMVKVSTVVKGIFPESAISMRGPIAFVHLDCDQHKSIIDSCLYLEPMMVKGGVMWFDDSPVLSGAEKAVMELYSDRVQILNGKHYVTF